MPNYSIMSALHQWKIEHFVAFCFLTVSHSSIGDEIPMTSVAAFYSPVWVMKPSFTWLPTTCSTCSRWPAEEDFRDVQMRTSFHMWCLEWLSMPAEKRTGSELTWQYCAILRMCISTKELFWNIHLRTVLDDVVPIKLNLCAHMFVG